MQDEFFQPVRSFFMSGFNCGIIGGRPKEAYWLVGIQDQNVILLDPHCTLQTLDNTEETLKENHMEIHED